MTFDPKLCRELADQCLRDHERMTPAPWTGDAMFTSRDYAIIKGPSWPVAGVCYDDDRRPVASEFAPGQCVVGDILGIARIRNSLPAIAAQLTAVSAIEQTAAHWHREAGKLAEMHNTVSAERDALRAELASMTRARNEVQSIAAGLRKQLSALKPLDAERVRHLTCDHCGKEPAACFGHYEGGEGDPCVACDTCCGHGNEDGWCVRLEDLPGWAATVNRSANALRDERDALMRERDAYRATVADLLASAHLYPVEHPAMTAQWDRARLLLKSGPPSPRPARTITGESPEQLTARPDAEAAQHPSPSIGHVVARSMGANLERSFDASDTPPDAPSAPTTVDLVPTETLGDWEPTP